MAGHPVRDRRANRRAVTLAVVLTVIVIVTFSVLIIGKARENAALESSVAALSESVSQEEAKNDELEEKKGQDLSLDEIIRIARERFGLIFKNEIVFIPEK